MVDTHASARATALVAFVALAVYLPSLSNGFAFDDARDVRDNPTVTDATGPLDVVTSPYRGGVPPARSPYRPVTALSFWLNHVSTGDAPLPFHLVNLLLHVLAAALVVRLLGALGASRDGATMGGLVFAVHPVHVEAVANVVGRADVLMTIFCLWGALAFLDRRLGSVTRASLVALAYALALGSKENGVALPALLAATLLVPGASSVAEDGRAEPDAPPEPDRPGRLRRELRVLAPALLVLGVYLVARERILGTLIHHDTAPYIVALPPTDRVTTAAANFTHFARLLLAPADLIADYGPDVVQVAGATSVRFWTGVLVAVLTAVLGWLLYRRRSLGAVAVAWCVLPLAVVSNLLFPIGVWVGERTLYLPTVGVSIGVATAVGFLGRAPRRKWMTWAAVAALVVAGGWRTIDRIPSWKSTDAMLSTLGGEHPESFRSQWWLARRLADVGDMDESLRWYDRALDTNPNDLGLALDHVRVLLLAGRPQEAEEIAAALPPTDPARFVYLAESRIESGLRGEARQDVRDGLRRFPSDERLRGQAKDLGMELPAR